MTSNLGPRAASAVALSLLLSGALAGSVQADGAVVVLPNAVSYENIGVIFFENDRSSDSIGTLTYTGPGCGGLCSATTQLGSDPFVSATVDEVGYDNSGGGTASSNLGYYVEYQNAPGTYSVDLHATDSLFTGSASVSAYLEFGVAGNTPSEFNNFQFNTPIELVEQDSTDTNCGSCFLGSNVPHFKTDNVVQMVANTPYFIQLGVNLDLEADGVPNGASVDPTFSDPTYGGTFVFSPGVSNAMAAPEPAPWAMMLVGLGAAGAVIRKSRGNGGARRVIA
jgi:hypothetical protein